MTGRRQVAGAGRGQRESSFSGSAPRLTASGQQADTDVVRIGSFFAREWERTCNECGYTWRLPRSVARRGIRGMSAIAVEGQAVSAQYSPSGGTGYRSGISARAEEMEGFRICARCGVDNFSQRPVSRGRTPPGTMP